jgi:ferritin-like metal-binding protein YciE
MGLFSSSPNFDSFDTLFVDQLEDLYDAEQRLVKALPKMADASHNRDLRNAFQTHLQQTKNHVSRLEEIFQSIGRKAKSKTCEAMKGLITEGEEMVNASGDSNVKDAALICAAQRVEHYEMAGYGCVRTFAHQLGHQRAVQLLEQTLDEEKEADRILNTIAEGHINVKAQQSRTAAARK